MNNLLPWHELSLPIWALVCGHKNGILLPPSGDVYVWCPFGPSLHNRSIPYVLLENYILQSNGTHKICGNENTKITYKKRETQIYVGHPTWLCQWKQLVLPLYYLVRWRDTTYNRSTVISSTLSHSAPFCFSHIIHIPCTTTIQYPHTKIGVAF